MKDVAPRPWRLWKANERSDLPHIADANGDVIARAEGNIWIWQDCIAPLIVSAVNASDVKLTSAEVQLLRVALDFWIDNIPQEDTNKKEFLQMDDLLKKALVIKT